MSINVRNISPEEEERLEQNRTTAQQNKRCLNCSGPLVFNPATQKMKCEYCESEYDISRELDADEIAQKIAAPASANAQQSGPGAPLKRNRHGERPISEAEHANCDWGSKKKMITCKTCGAQTIYEATQATSACPYCDSNLIMEEENKDSMAPTGICVFKVTRESARDEFYKWVKGLWFAPNSLKRLARADSIEGVYLPHWTFDTDTTSQYRGEYGIESKDSQGHTKVTWHNCQGHFIHTFDDYLMPACRKENDYILRSLAPFDTNDYEDYKPEYMVGYAAERYSVSVHDSWAEAQKRMKDDLRPMIESQIKRDYPRADRARVNELNTEYSEAMFKYLLLPIWISSYSFNGKVYHFMVNGQSGKVSGDRPYSWIKIISLVVVIIAVIYILSHK